MTKANAHVKFKLEHEKCERAHQSSAENRLRMFTTPAQMKTYTAHARRACALKNQANQSEIDGNKCA